ncbi:MAG: TlpA disulfide reductase family protein [Alsobacter sp.]
MTPTTPNSTSEPRGPRRGLPLALGLALSVTLAVAVLYGTRGVWSNAAQAADCQPARGLADAMRPLARGEVAAVQVAKEPKLLPDLAFTDADGKPVTLASFRGKTVLFNLWATWCVPCRKEMPALDALQKTLGGPGFEVVAVNIDTRNLDKPKAWLAENGVNALAYRSDPAAKVFQELQKLGKAFGMPTTLIVDPKGCELATLAGPAEWSSEDALKLIKAAMGG